MSREEHGPASEAAAHPLRLVPLVARAEIASRPLAALKEKLATILPGHWKFASQARSAAQPLVIFGTKPVAGMPSDFMVYEVDPAAGSARLVCEIPPQYKSITDVALLPDDRLAVLVTGELLLASVAPAFQVIDSLKPVSALECLPVLDGRVLALRAYQEEDDADDLPPDFDPDADFEEIAKAFERHEDAKARREELDEEGEDDIESPSPAFRWSVRIVGVSDGLASLGEVDAASTHTIHEHEGRIILSGAGQEGDRELVGAREAYASLPPAGKVRPRAQRRGGAVDARPTGQLTTPSFSSGSALFERAGPSPIAALGITEVAASVVGPPDLPAVRKKTKALVRPADWISPRYGRYAFMLRGVPGGRYAAAVADDEAAQIVPIAPEIVAKSFSYEFSCDAKQLVLAADKAVYLVDPATGAATVVLRSDDDALSAIAVGELIAVVRRTPSSQIVLEFRDAAGDLVGDRVDLVAESLAVVAGGKVLVATPVNYRSESHFFAVRGRTWKLLGRWKTTQGVWDDGSKTYAKDYAGQVFELRGLEEAAERCVE
jgi:hypothetical protein